MSLIRLLLWSLIVAAVLAAALFAVRTLDVTDRLTDIFLTLSPRLPSWVSFEQFLIVTAVACGLVMVLTVGLGLVAFAMMQGAIVVMKGKQAAHELAVQRALERLKTQTREEYERLIGLSATLTQRLEKQALLQNILRVAAQVTSLPRADSTVALWVLDFETERMRFEMGLGCDAAWFTKREFELTESPMTRLLSGNQVLRFADWKEGFPFLAQEKAARLPQATAVLLVPCIIERTVLGCVVAFCHPDVLASYPQQESFFNTAWGQLTLALSIAIQGELAMLDRLTGLVNHAYFMKRLSQEMERCDRYHASLGLLMLDIDHFKAVNDTLGHQQGDAVLKTVAKLIKKEVRAIDLVGRYGGEEFIVMLPETVLTEAERERTSGAMIVAERIRKAVEAEFQSQPPPRNITVSLGVAIHRYPEDRRMDVEALVRLADEQLYLAKTTGRNRCCLYTPPPTTPTPPPA